MPGEARLAREPTGQPEGRSRDALLRLPRATAIAGARHLTDEHHANAEHDSITLKER